MTLHMKTSVETTLVEYTAFGSVTLSGPLLNQLVNGGRLHGLTELPGIKGNVSDGTRLLDDNQNAKKRLGVGDRE